MIVIFSRKRRLVKCRLSHTGWGLFLGAALVILAAVTLPLILKSKIEP